MQVENLITTGMKDAVVVAKCTAVTTYEKMGMESYLDNSRVLCSRRCSINVGCGSGGCSDENRSGSSTESNCGCSGGFRGGYSGGCRGVRSRSSRSGCNGGSRDRSSRG